MQLTCHTPPSINLHPVEVPPAANRLDTHRRRDSSPPGLGNSTNNWFEVEVRAADKHKENSKANHNSLDLGYSVCRYFRNCHLRVRRYHNWAGCSKAAGSAPAFLHAVQASRITGSAAGFASGFAAISTAAG